jgi:serine/threonine-protein kinase
MSRTDPDAPTLEAPVSRAGTLVPDGGGSSASQLSAGLDGLAPLPALPAPWLDPVLICNGTHGQLYAVVDQKSRRAAVLKTTRPGADRRAREGLRREAAVLLSLSTPGTPRLLAELHLADGRPAIVMSRAPGLHLGEWRHRIGRIPTAAAVAATVAACEVVQGVHGAGLVHTALQPAHVLRDVRGRVHVIDWRHAVPVGSTARGAPSPTVAPELQGRSAPATPATDVWGLAALLLHLLNGTAPPSMAHGPTGARIPLPADPLLTGTPGKLLRSVLARALDPDPELRISDARALGRELAGWWEAFGAPSA